MAILMITAGGILAQTTFASLRGTIHDAADAAIANATVIVKNSATGVFRDTLSDATGAWAAFNLPPSRYEVTIAAPGFATERRTDVELTVNAEEVLDFSLNPSTVQSTVDAHAEARGIDLESAAIREVEDARVVRELPLNGRDWTALTLLAPGVSAIRTQNALNGSNSNRGSRGFGSAVTVGGTRPTQNSYLVDGISQNDYTNGAPGGALGLALGVDAIEEFSVLINNYSAAYGGASGGVINAVSRSGTSALHGDLYEFLRNDKLDARNFFDGQKPPLRRNQFGAALWRKVMRLESTRFRYRDRTDDSRLDRVHQLQGRLADGFRKQGDEGMREVRNAIRILAVDDHPMFRDGLAAILATQRDMNLVAQAANGREAIQQFRHHRPDITLMDLQMPEMNGLDAMVAIRGEFPEAKIIILTTYGSDAPGALKLGARAYVLKAQLDRELLGTIRSVYAGN